MDIYKNSLSFIHPLAIGKYEFIKLYDMTNGYTK